MGKSIDKRDRVRKIPRNMEATPAKTPETEGGALINLISSAPAKQEIRENHPSFVNVERATHEKLLAVAKTRKLDNYPKFRS